MFLNNPLNKILGVATGATWVRDSILSKFINCVNLQVCYSKIEKLDFYGKINRNHARIDANALIYKVKIYWPEVSLLLRCL